HRPGPAPPPAGPAPAAGFPPHSPGRGGRTPRRSAAWPPGGRGRRHGWPRLGTDWGPAATTAPPAQKCAWCSPPGPWTWRRNWGATGRDPRGRQLATAWLQPAPGTAAGTAPRGWRPGPVPP